MQFATEPDYRDGEFVGVKEVAGWSLLPLALDDLTRQAVADHARALGAFLRPAQVEQLRPRLTTLLAHWRVPDVDDETAGGLAIDWLRHIGQYPLWAVEEACDEWLRLESRKPQIANIRRLCDEAVRPYVVRQRILEKAMQLGAPR